jgi:cell division protease FtsH
MSGVTLSTPETDRYSYDETYLRGRIVGALGGMAAEEVFGVVTTGAGSDLENSTRIAKAMAGRWGMSDRIGPISVLRARDPRPAGGLRRRGDSASRGNHRYRPCRCDARVRPPQPPSSSG